MILYITAMNMDARLGTRAHTSHTIFHVIIGDFICYILFDFDVCSNVLKRLSTLYIGHSIALARNRPTARVLHKSHFIYIYFVYAVFSFISLCFVVGLFCSCFWDAHFVAMYAMHWIRYYRKCKQKLIHIKLVIGIIFLLHTFILS